MSKSVKYISGFLGISMFMFGFLKFFDPFKSWYTSQVAHSGFPFPEFSYWAGQLGEMFCGIALLGLLLLSHSLNRQSFKLVFVGVNSLIVIMMVAAVFVHLNPNVPTDVLPLKIRPPFIPGIFMLLAFLNIIFEKKFLATS